MTGRRYIVSGRVQGVGYRYFAQQTALRLGIRGWVRNLPAGDVEIHAEAAESVLAEFREALKRGPRMAEVSRVIEETASITEQFSSFHVKG